MERICAWCGRSLGSSGELHPGGISHGICRSCAEDLAAGSGIPLGDYLANLGIPVVLANGRSGPGETTADGPAKPARHPSHAASLAPPAAPELVYECAYALDEAACDLSVHCSGCVIRHAVEHTYRTGEPRQGVAATLKRVKEPAAADVVMHISTRLERGRVLVQIDDAGAG